MRKREAAAVLAVVVILLMFSTVCTSPAQKNTIRDVKQSARMPSVPTNTVTGESDYRDQCGRCHQAFQAQLLPSASWLKILNNVDNHFGERVELEPSSNEIIAQYLATHSAERSNSKIAGKIMKSLGTQTPERISDVPYIKRKHHGIDPKVLRRASVGSLANCPACHLSAPKGIYKDHDVRIPR